MYVSNQPCQEIRSSASPANAKPSAMMPSSLPHDLVPLVYMNLSPINKLDTQGWHKCCRCDVVVKFMGNGTTDQP